MATARMMGMRANWLGMALAGVLAFMLLPSPAKGFLMGQGFTYTPVINPVISSGHVMARAQVVGPNGGPILVKVRSSGAGGQSSTVEVEEIGEAYAGGPLEGVYVLSGSAYRDVLRQLAQLRARYPERMARAEFLPAQQLASGLSLADGSSSPGVTLPDHIKTVVVWGRQDRLSPETDAHILLSVPFQLDAGTSLAEDVSSLLMNPDGSIRALAHGSGVGEDSFSVESFTWRTAFYAQPGSTEQSDQRVDRNEDTIFGPISTAILEQVGWFGTMYAVTDADGYYFMNSPMLCMRNSFGGYLLPGMDTNLILTVSTVPFNPNRMGIPPYYELRDVYAGCSDNIYPYRLDFLIDVLWLVGELHLSNTPGGAAIPVGSNVSYEGQDRSGEPTVRVWDYDGDGESDKAVLAHKRTITDPDTGESFVIPDLADDGGYQAVYFSSGDRVPPPREGDITDPARHVPDLWRLADRTLDGRPAGLLTEISEDALRHTDVYIFRESTGELLVEVSGLPEGPYAGRASRIENNAYLWHTLLRGRESIRNNFAAYGTSSGTRSSLNEEAFRERSEELGFSSRYQSRDADMPSPGEMLYVVAINRVTGYTGSVRFELGTANSPGGAQQRVPALELLPPNVRVWAQRLTEIEAGLTAGEQREYLISHEGAHTANDLIVGLYSDWRAADGSPLPNALGQVRGADFGLTGRLAKVRDGQLVPVTAGQAVDSSITLEDALAAGSQGAVAEFPIGPGQNLQLLRLPNAETAGNEHYYVNLFGRALNKEICSHCQYDQAGMHPTLAGRPNHFAPLYVPRYDQVGTDALRQRARELEAEAEEGEDAIEVDPQYLWALRPEYQFSQIDFRVDELGAVRVDEGGVESIRNLLDSKNPVITSSDDLIRALYGLTLPGADPLLGLDGSREYVLALGEEEIRIVIGEDRSLDITNIQTIAGLSIEDFLSLRLYLNSDPENALWEWAFKYLNIYTPHDHRLNDHASDIFLVGADEDYVDIEVSIAGASLDGEIDRVEWRVEGAGVLEKNHQISDYGISRNRLYFSKPTSINSVIRVMARLEGTEAWAEFLPIMFTSGDVASVSLGLRRDIYADKHSKDALSVELHDSQGNPVLDGTPFFLSSSGGLSLSRYSGRTVDGLATIGISAVESIVPGEITVSAYSGDNVYHDQISVPVIKPELDVVEFPDTMHVGEKGRVAVRASVAGVGVDGVSIRLDAPLGVIESVGNGITNSEGKAEFYITPTSPGTIRFNACSGMSGCTEEKYFSVEGGEGYASYGVDYVISLAEDGIVSFRPPGGVEGDFFDHRGRLTLDYAETDWRLGGLTYPNKVPFLQFPSQGMDDLDRAHAMYMGSKVVVPEFPKEIYRDGVSIKGYPFYGDGEISLAPPTAKSMRHIGGALSFTVHEADATLFSIEGVITVRVDTQGRLVIDSPLHEFSHVMDGVNIGQQHTNDFSFRFDESGYVAVLNGANHSDYVGEPARWQLKEVVVGEGLLGDIYGLSLYDPYSDDVLVVREFDGSESMPHYFDVSLDGGSVSGSIQYIEMHSDQKGRAIIAISPEEHFVSAVSANYALIDGVDVSGSEAFHEGIRLAFSRRSSHPSIDNVAASLIQGGAGNRSMAMHYGMGLYSYAKLYHQEDVLSGALSFIESNASDDFIDLFISDYAEIRNSNFVYSGMKKSEFLVPLLVLGEMATSNAQEASLLLDLMSDHRFYRTWKSFLLMPRNGWIGVAPSVPSPDVNCGSDYLDIDGIYLPLLPCRISGDTAAEIISMILDVDPGLYGRLHEVSEVMEMIVQQVGYIDPSLRSMLMGSGPVMLPHDGSQYMISATPKIGPLLVALARLGLKVSKEAVQNYVAFFSNRSNSRVDPVIFSASMGYLWSRSGVSTTDEGYNFEAETSIKIRRDILRAMTIIGSTKRFKSQNQAEISCSLYQTSHGILFELMVAAYFKASEEFLGRSEYKIIDVQQYIRIPILNENDEEVLTYGRFSDIVIAGSAVLPVRVEMKSAHGGSHRGAHRYSFEKFKNRWPRWDINHRIQSGRRGKTHAHRQLILDELTKTGVHLSSGDMIFGSQTASDYLWLWQDWNYRDRGRYRRARDPGQSMWQATPAGSHGNAGEWLKDHYKSLGPYAASRQHLLRMLNRSPRSNYQLPLGGRVLGGDRFRKFNASQEIKAYVLSSMLENIDPVWGDIVDYGTEVRDILAHVDQMVEVVAGYVPGILRDGHHLRREILEGLLNSFDEFEQDVIEYVGDMFSDDSFFSRGCE